MSNDQDSGLLKTLQTPPTIAPDIITADLRPDLFGERSLEREIDADLGNPAYCSAFGEMLRPEAAIFLAIENGIQEARILAQVFRHFPQYSQLAHP